MDDKREIIERLHEVWQKEPKLRLAQLLWLSFESTDYFYLTDEEFIKTIEHRFDK